MVNGGKNMIEAHCMHIWKDNNETYLKIARRLKKGVAGEGRWEKVIERVNMKKSTLYACLEMP
jgi:hypothetical protein